MFILFIRRHFTSNRCNKACIFNKKKLFSTKYQEALIFQLITKMLCHLRMTPLCTIPQYVNDAPYTTPAEKGPKIGPRVYCRVLIFSGPLLRTSLNDALQIAVELFCT